MSRPEDHRRPPKRIRPALYSGAYTPVEALKIFSQDWRVVIASVSSGAVSQVVLVGLFILPLCWQGVNTPSVPSGCDQDADASVSLIRPADVQQMLTRGHSYKFSSVFECIKEIRHNEGGLRKGLYRGMCLELPCFTTFTSWLVYRHVWTIGKLLRHSWLHLQMVSRHKVLHR